MTKPLTATSPEVVAVLQATQIRAYLGVFPTAESVIAYADRTS